MKRLEIKDIEKCVGCGLCMFACSRKFASHPEIGNSSSAILPVSLSGFERGATVIFCKACSEPPCAQVCPTGALKPKKGGGVVYIERLCIGCKYCVEACTLNAIFEREDGKIAVCIHCGYCVNYCPHGVLEYREVKT
ncbi:4Fe-4S binding protein [Archaeoglobus neptunius]|uniref:4Fe-4S binding protein n=1 Tax=Archaeoglobus neptunius TaxID=2798580 RepID=UPI001926183F|nr:4Fe-4S binding protein [Archaeoglobus neptunius]